jgi:hypothetical protein
MESSNFRSRPGYWQERGKSLATTVRFKARSQVIQDVVALLPTGRYYSQHSLDESAPLRTIGPAAYPPPDHCMTQRAFNCVVRRRNSLDACEAPQTFLHFEKLEARRRCLRARAPRPFQKGPLDLALQAAHPLLKRIPRQGPVTHLVPVAEQSVRQRKQSSSDSLTVAGSVNHRLKVSTQMRPADLSTGRLDPLIRAEPITADYLIVFATQESRGDLAAAVLGDGKDCAQAGHRGPQPSLLAILAPRRLVDINHLGMVDRSREF